MCNFKKSELDSMLFWIISHIKLHFVTWLCKWTIPKTMIPNVRRQFRGQSVLLRCSTFNRSTNQSKRTSACVISSHVSAISRFQPYHTSSNRRHHVKSTVGKTMPFLPSPSHHHKYFVIEVGFQPFPVMGGWNPWACATTKKRCHGASHPCQNQQKHLSTSSLHMSMSIRLKPYQDPYQDP